MCRGRACQTSRLRLVAAYWREGARSCVWPLIGWWTRRDGTKCPLGTHHNYGGGHIYSLCSGRDAWPAWQYGMSLPTFGWNAGPVNKTARERRSSPRGARTIHSRPESQHTSLNESGNEHKRYSLWRLHSCGKLYTIRWRSVGLSVRICYLCSLLLLWLQLYFPFRRENRFHRI
jgi:hypothetical protein